MIYSLTKSTQYITEKFYTPATKSRNIISQGWSSLIDYSTYLPWNQLADMMDRESGMGYWYSINT